MAFRKTFLSGLNSISKSYTAKSLSKPTLLSSETALFPRFLHQDLTGSSSAASAAITMPVGEKLMDKIRVLRGERLQLGSISPPPHSMTQEEVRKVLKMSKMEKVKMRLRAVKAISISYSQFVQICCSVDGDVDGTAIAKDLDQSGAVLVIGDVVFLNPELDHRSVAMARATDLWVLQIQLMFIVLSILYRVGFASPGITSSFVRSQWPSIDIPLDNEVFAVPKGYNAPQQVHITQGDYDGKSVIISWVTVEEPGSNEVSYGSSEHHYNYSSYGEVNNYTFYNYKSGFIHHCLIDGLLYDTKYYYKIGSGVSAREFSFKTPPKTDPDTPYVFGIIGDLGQTYNSLSTLEHYMQSEGQTVLFVGDLSYADKCEYNDGNRWDSWGRLVENSTAYQPWIWTAGNHEIEYRPDLGETDVFKPYLHRYMTPFKACGSSSSLWYGIRRASAHIIVLSSYSSFVKYSPQWKWLEAELERVDREKTPWLIVLMHAPLYNSNEAHYMEGESMRSAFEAWFIRYKVDLVFAGHVHAYERSYRISNIQYNITSCVCCPVPDKSAPVYITVGDGGNKEGLASMFLNPQPDYSAFREASYGHSTLELKNRTHALYHWNRNDDGQRVPTDSIVIFNQYWAGSSIRRKLKKQHSNNGTMSI